MEDGEGGGTENILCEDAEVDTDHFAQGRRKGEGGGGDVSQSCVSRRRNGHPHLQLLVSGGGT